MFVQKIAKLQPSDVLDTEFLVAQSLAFEFWVRGAEKALRGWGLEFQVSAAGGRERGRAWASVGKMWRRRRQGVGLGHGSWIVHCAEREGVLDAFTVVGTWRDSPYDESLVSFGHPATEE